MKDLRSTAPGLLRMSRRSLVLGAALGAGSLLVLSGCSNSGDSDEDTWEGADKTVILGLSKTWETLNVADIMNTASHQVVSQIFDRPMYLNEENAVEPRGVTSWEWSDDGMTLTLHLNENATWHDGEKVTAEDYRFSYTFYSTSEVQFTNRAGSKYLVGVDPDTGIEESEDSVGVNVLDDYTVEFSMNAAYNQTLYTYSPLMTFYILPRHCFLNDDGTLMSDSEIYSSSFWNAPIGSGPFIYESEVTDSSITLKANTSYHLGCPHFGTLIMQVIDTSTAVDKLLAGDVDVLGFTISTEIAEQYLDDKNLRIYPETSPSSQVNLCFNCKRVPQKIRQAVDRGLDKEDILNKLYSGNGFVNYSVVFPEYPGYKERDIYDVEEAAALVQEAIDDGDWSEDSTLIIGVVSTSGENTAILIKSQLADLGIKVEIKQDEMSTIQQAMMTDLGTSDDFQYSCGLWSLGAGYVPTTTMVTYAMYADYLFFHNDASLVFPIYSAFITATSEREEEELIGQFQDWEYDYVPQSTIVQYGAYSATDTRMSNVDLFAFSNYNYASWLWTAE